MVCSGKMRLCVSETPRKANLWRHGPHSHTAHCHYQSTVCLCVILNPAKQPAATRHNDAFPITNHTSPPRTTTRLARRPDAARSPQQNGLESLLPCCCSKYNPLLPSTGVSTGARPRPSSGVRLPFYLPSSSSECTPACRLPCCLTAPPAPC